MAYIKEYPGSLRLRRFRPEGIGGGGIPEGKDGNYQAFAEVWGL